MCMCETWNPRQTINIIFLFVCCRFDDFDDAIDEAIEEDIGDLCGGEWIMWWLQKSELQHHKLYLEYLFILHITSWRQLIFRAVFELSKNMKKP